MKIGLMLNEPAPGPDPIGALTATIARAEADGFASIWMAQIFGIDTLTALAVAGRTVPRIEMGTGVVPIYPRHPSVLAQQALTVQAAIGGRLSLGIGLSHKVVVESMWGESFDKPARRMDEYLSVLLPLLETGNVAFQGETVRAMIGLQTPRTHRVPVLLAALAPRMLKIAGSRTDGTVLWMTGPATIDNHVAPAITSAASEAGRPQPRIVCALPVAVTNDVDAARVRANEVFAIYGQLPSYRAMLDREGAASPGDVAIVGDEDTVRSRVEALADIGVTEFVGAVFADGADAERTNDVLRSLAAERVG